MITYPCLRYLLLATKSYHSLRRDARCLIWLQLVPEGLHIYGYHILFAQITKTLGSTSIRHRSDTFSSDRCLVNVDPMVFIYGHLMPRISLIFADRQAAFFTSFSWLFFIEPTLHYPFLPYTSRLPDVKPGAIFFIFSFDAFIVSIIDCHNSLSVHIDIIRHPAFLYLIETRRHMHVRQVTGTSLVYVMTCRLHEATLNHHMCRSEISTKFKKKNHCWKFFWKRPRNVE